MAQCQGARTEMVRLFLVFTYLWQEDFEIIPKVREAPCIGVARGVRLPPPIEMQPMIKMYQKSLLFLQF